MNKLTTTIPAGASREFRTALSTQKGTALGSAGRAPARRRPDRPARYQLTPWADTAKAPHVVVVSLAKSGTHLVREVISALGYALRGTVFSSPQEQPVLPAEQMWRVLQLIYLPDELDELVGCCDPAVVDRGMKRAIVALNESWRLRLGILQRGLAVNDERDGETLNALTVRALSRPEAKSFVDTPDNTCWFLHELALDRVDEFFLRQWSDTGKPRIIFNYRDPRDVLVSMVNFLSGESPGRVSGSSLPRTVVLGGRLRIHGDILRTAETFDDRLNLALTDPTFPGADAFENALWLLRHPDVCKVSFEELVGPSGGGSETRQRAAVQRVIDFLGADADVEKIAEQLFDKDSFTFLKGQIGGWREHFTQSHEAMFNERYGKILELYSYASGTDPLASVR
ncbi:hypothetical protein [Nocardia sp. R6R-6]|uniref:hypothetical protein n=1 Tax=Nocardia sp. R6R-6 TaxID=3459303 RepID=UPI00403E1531